MDQKAAASLEDGDAWAGNGNEMFDQFARDSADAFPAGQWCLGWVLRVVNGKFNTAVLVAGLSK